MSHTKGPWYPRKNGEGLGFDIQATSMPVTIARIPKIFNMEENEANAKLIAAAPDMLIALKVADEVLSTWFSSEYTEHEIAHKVREAIKKAETK